MSFPRHTKIYQSDEPEGGRTNGSTSLGDHRSDESSVGYSFVGCSPAEPASASPTATSLSQHPAAVNCSAAKRNLSPFLLSHLRGPLQLRMSQDDSPGYTRVGIRAAVETMSHSHTCCLVHVVFATAERRPMIRQDVQEVLRRYMGGIARRMEFKHWPLAAPLTTSTCCFPCRPLFLWPRPSNCLNRGLLNGFMRIFQS